MRHLYLILALILLTVPAAGARQRLARVLVSTPRVEDRAFSPLSDVLGGVIIRELNRYGGVEIVPAASADSVLAERGNGPGIKERETAIDIGETLGADIVIYTELAKNYDMFIYTINFLEVERDVLQRSLRGSFPVSVSAQTIGRQVSGKVETLLMYIPTPTELDDPAAAYRDDTVDPFALPSEARIDDYPQMGYYGIIEQVLAHYRVFPGQEELEKFNQQSTITRLDFRDDMDEELNVLLNRFRFYGDFAVRYNMQAYLVKDCSIRAINVLLANKIPVLYSEDGRAVLTMTGYAALGPDGYCVFFRDHAPPVESYDVTHRQRVAVLIILPKPGRRGGVSREYIQNSIAHFKDEWGRTPTLIELNEAFYDIISSGLNSGE